MTQTIRTPGPWRIGDAGHTVFGLPNGNPSPQTIAHPPTKADARLIAAAPDLLVALQTALEWLEAAQADEPDDWENEPLDNAVDSARAAIAKATGNDQ